MKQLIILMSFGLMAIASCSKSKTSGENSDKSIVGRWNYYRSYSSNGSAFIYTSKEDLHEWIDFEADGKFSANMPAFRNIIKWELQDTQRSPLLLQLRFRKVIII